LREWVDDDSLLPIPLDVLVRKTSRVLKMKKGKVAKTVDEYLAAVPEPAQSTLKHLREVIRSVVPKETTEAISYGIPMFKFNGMLVGYAAFKKHCSLFPTGSGVLDQFEKELRGYRTSKGTIQFPADKPLSDALVKRIVRARVKENKEWD
jgi:uncharacterized protein YdhG (YjbR/CyaY superfamily)